MNTKKLINKLTEDWLAKVICIAAAILIYVFHQVAVLDKKTFTIPVNVISDGLLINETAAPGYIRVTVRCSSDSIGVISPQAVKANINLNQYTEAGEYDVPIDISLASELMLIEPLEITVKPEYVTLVLDEKVEKFVQVTPSVSGEVSHGYVIKNIDIVPSTVKIIGPSKIVEKTNYIYTDKVNVKGAATGFSTEVGLDNINRLVHPQTEGKFKVTVSITPAPSEQSFKGITPKLISLEERFVNEAEIPPLNFTLAGTVPVMESFKLKDEHLVVDCSAINAQGRYELPVYFSLPGNISVKEKSYSTVTLVITDNPDFVSEETEKVESDELLETSEEETKEVYTENSVNGAEQKGENPEKSGDF